MAEKPTAPTVPDPELNGQAKPNPYDPFDPANLRINAAANIEVGTVLTTVPVRKPKRTDFIRVHPDPAYTVDMYVLEREDGMDHEDAVVLPEVQSLVLDELRLARVVTYVNRRGTLRPVADPVARRGQRPQPPGRRDSADVCGASQVAVGSGRVERRRFRLRDAARQGRHRRAAVAGQDHARLARNPVDQLPDRASPITRSSASWQANCERVRVAAAETPRQVREWDLAEVSYLRRGLCPKCAAQAAWGHQ